MNHPVYRFDRRTLDHAARELRFDGGLVKLSPKVFDCLAYLIEHRDRAVGRDELIAAVWGRVDVSDTLLGQTVLKARRAMGDTGNDQAAIRTIPRFGYRWVGAIALEPVADSAPFAASTADPPAAPAVDAVADAVPAAPPVPSPASPAHPSSARRTGRLVGIAVFALLLVAALPWWRQRAAETTPMPAAGHATTPTAVDTAAVLPFATSAGDDWAWLRLGLMDLVAQRLRGAGQAVVPSDNVVALTRTAGADADTVRAATGARYLVVPRAERIADGWRVRLELRGDGTVRNVEARAADAIEAARLASDRLLALLGRTAPPASDTPSGLSLAELQQRAEAALLSDDFTTARQVIEAAPPALRDTPELRLRLAQIDFRSGQLDAAGRRLQALRAEISGEADPVLRARVLYQLGAVAVREDRSGDAEHAFAESAALVANRNEPGVLGQAYTGLAAARVNLGRYEEAADDLARARIALDLAGDTLALARVDANEGILDNARGRPAEALQTLRRAETRFRRFGALNELFLTVAAEIKADLDLLDPAAALAASEAAWLQISQLDNPRTRNALALQRARALAAVGRSAEAGRVLDQLSADIGPDEHSGLPGDVASSRAGLLLAGGDAAAAADAARDAVAHLPTVDEAHERARAWLTLARALRASGHADDAALQTRRFGEWAGAPGAPQAAALHAALAAAEQDWSAHARDDAWRNYLAALSRAERWGVPADLAAVAISYGGALIADGDLERASAVVGRVARWADRDFACAVLQARLYRALGRNDAWSTALARARGLAGERSIPPAAANPPPQGVAAGS